MCRYPTSSAHCTALTVVDPLGTCQTPRPSTGIELPSASTFKRLSAVFEPEVMNVSCLFPMGGVFVPAWLPNQNYDVSWPPFGRAAGSYGFDRHPRDFVIA